MKRIENTKTLLKLLAVMKGFLETHDLFVLMDSAVIYIHFRSSQRQIFLKIAFSLLNVRQRTYKSTAWFRIPFRTQFAHIWQQWRRLLFFLNKSHFNIATCFLIHKFEKSKRFKAVFTLIHILIVYILIYILIYTFNI